MDKLRRYGWERTCRKNILLLLYDIRATQGYVLEPLIGACDGNLTCHENQISHFCTRDIACGYSDILVWFRLQSHPFCGRHSLDSYSLVQPLQLIWEILLMSWQNVPFQARRCCLTPARFRSGVRIPCDGMHDRWPRLRCILSVGHKH